MDQFYNNGQNDFLWRLLANPADDAHLYNYNIQRLVNDFPQSGLLQALLAHTSDDKNLKKASAYFNARSLYKLINVPDSFPAVKDEQIITKFNGSATIAYQEEEPVQATEETPAPDEYAVVPAVAGPPAIADQLEEIQVDIPEIPADQIPVSEPYGDDHEVGPVADEMPPPVPVEHIEEASPENIAAEEQEEPVAEDYYPQEGPVTEVELDQEHNDVPQTTIHDEPADQPVAQIEEETFDEITGIDAMDIPARAEDGDTAPQAPVVETPEPVAAATAEAPVSEVAAPEDEIPVAEEKEALHDDTDKHIIGNIAATDFFMFEKAFGESHSNSQPESTHEAPVAEASEPVEPTVVAGEKAEQPVAAEPDNKDVSMYNDERLPYSFLWWLDKTRKEHSGIYQPYIHPPVAAEASAEKKEKDPTDALQQQYYENIFHITTMEELEKTAQPPKIEFGRKKKEHVIMERFIQEEPQIRPQSSDKLDNENKAKKSSEDRDELVTETLAMIYTDQMLYHKAISSYKKLMLKFPEKSSYFAGKIEQLEKRTN